uniref:Uncharacterized protein n=1 Tax=Panagrolaimus superbus TaxID=310955 RepID=A0A914Y2M8_9BILA
MGAFSLCALIFPIFQKWVRREKSSGFQLSPESAKSVKSLKQASGIFTEIVVEYVIARPSAPWSEQLLLGCLHLLNEFIAHSSQAISGIGTACLRHLIQSISEHLTEPSWKIISFSLWRTTSITLSPLRRICFHYFSESSDLGGDIGEVSVGVRKEDSDRDHAELQIMAKQVFTILEDSAPTIVAASIRTSRTTVGSMDSTPNTPSSPIPSNSSISTRQLPYVFKLCKKDSPNPESLSLEDIVISLLNQQVLIQLFSGILLGEQSQILSNGAFTTNNPTTTTKEPSKRSKNDKNTLFTKAPTKSIGILLHCLESITTVAALFDDRPAVKLLFQKLCGLEQNANLYKYTIASQSVKLVSIYEIARNEESDSENDKKEHTKILERSLRSLLEGLKKYDEEAATNKLASFARDRLDQKIKISLVENNEKIVDGIKIFSIVGTAKCLEEYKKQKRVDSLPSRSRANPFFGKMDSTTRAPTASSASSCSAVTPNERLQLSQLCDLDLRILAYSEIIALCIEKFVSDETAIFARLLPILSPITVDFLRIATNLRARNCIADFISRLCNDHEKSDNNDNINLSEE